jgi:hypothetical protein
MRAFDIFHGGRFLETVFFKDSPALTPKAVRDQLARAKECPPDADAVERELTPQDRGLLRSIQPTTPSQIAAGLCEYARQEGAKKP